ncbi:MAG: Rieske 2Fe-2S domain-containing protein [Nitrososphaerota archaeon]|nr:Rieske 2Fe-2S domain-containing protein [Nitrososphaerota archaeon]
MYAAVCNESELSEGEMTKYEFNNRWILLAKAGSFWYACDSSCTHEEADLSLGILCENTVTCPLHRAKFDLKTGQVLEGPNGDDPTTIPTLRVYKTKVEEGKVLVDL